MKWSLFPSRSVETGWVCGCAAICGWRITLYTQGWLIGCNAPGQRVIVKWIWFTKMKLNSIPLLLHHGYTVYAPWGNFTKHLADLVKIWEKRKKKHFEMLVLLLRRCEASQMLRRSGCLWHITRTKTGNCRTWRSFSYAPHQFGSGR